MVEMVNQALAYAQAHEHQSLDQLRRFVRFPTVSAEAKYAAAIVDCANWLAAHLARAGLDKVRVFRTARHPIVYGAWNGAPGQPTLLVYGHYDVKPVQGQKWTSQPFEPVVRNSYLHGRGTSDDKGPLWAHIKAIEAYLQTSGRLPLNIRVLLDGEEEIGSPNLAGFVRMMNGSLDADVAAISDTRMLAADKPAITYSERGSLGVQIVVSGPKHDLHGGQFGGAVHNPLQALAEIIARLHTPGGKVAIPGFYRRVRGLSEGERVFMRHVGPSDALILKDAGVKHAWGEPGYTLYERTTARPALVVSGISIPTGGELGIPARAVAELRVKLVPDQDPEEIDILFRRQLALITPKGVTARLHRKVMVKPVTMNRNHYSMHAARDAYQQAFGRRAVFLRSGGTIPVVVLLKEQLGIPTVLMGFSLPDDKIHAANERFYLPNFYRGIRTCIWFYANLSREVEGERGVPGAQRIAI